MKCMFLFVFFFVSSRRRHTRSLRDWSSDMCSSDLTATIALRPYTLTAAILAGEPAAVGELPALDPMICGAARCFRLANDLRSDVRERAEGKLNAVSLLQ